MILVLFVLVVRRIEAPREYLESIEEKRGQTELFMAQSPDSPLPAEQRSSFQGLSYFPPDPAYRVKARLERPVLSLDFRGDGLVGPAELRREPWLWPDDLIVMSISRVGSDLGPDITLLESLLRASPGKRVYAAGGVRHLVDLHRLRDLGAAGALVSTALHQGRIASAAIRALSAA